MRRYTGQQPRNEGRSQSADQPLINYGSTSDFVLPSVYIELRFFRDSGEMSRTVSSVRCRSRERVVSYPSCFLSGVSSFPAPPPSPPRRAPLRPDWPVVCSGFGFDRFLIDRNSSIDLRFIEPSIFR